MSEDRRNKTLTKLCDDLDIELWKGMEIADQVRKDLILSEEEIIEVMEEHTKNHPIARSEIWQEGNRKMIAKAIIQARDKKLNKD